MPAILEIIAQVTDICVAAKRTKGGGGEKGGE